MLILGIGVISCLGELFLMLGEYLSLLEIEYLAVSLVYVVSMLAWLAAIEIK
jgi:hypothetical protein